jgi:hypothetical protein
MEISLIVTIITLVEAQDADADDGGGTEDAANGAYDLVIWIAQYPRRPP